MKPANRPLLPLVGLFFLGVPSSAAAEEEGYHPYFTAPQVRTIDMSAARQAAAGTDDSAAFAGPSFDELDEVAAAGAEREPRAPGQLPDGLVQQGNVVVPAGVANGDLTVTHRPMSAVEDIPGNAYPRKHTVFLNFTGGMLFTGSDNSAESRSSLARQGVYPTFSGGEATALAAVQAFENDVAQFGIVVEYQERPGKTAPYTMVMIGGNWTDTNIDMPAGGVAPGTDCGALGQRHVVYVFSGGGGTSIANVASQEAGHAWGLDHSFNCSSVMAYCGGGNQSFSGTCDGVCESQCQGKAGCFSTHDMFCGEDSGNQNEVAELSWIFGGNEPDLEPPTAEIVSPEDGMVLPEGSSVNFRAIVDDNYGGFGWKFIISHNGEELLNEVDYDRDVDAQYRAALNLVNLDPGTYVLTVEVEDQYDQITSDTVTITVDGEVVGETDTGADTDSGPVDTDDPTAAGSGSGPDTGADTDGPDSAGNSDTAQTGPGVNDDTDDDDDDDGDDDNDSGSSGAGGDDGADPGRGCGCLVDQQPNPFGALLLLGFVALVRRRTPN